MRFLVTEVYKIEELDDDSRSNAYKTWLYNLDEQSGRVDDHTATLNAFAEAFKITIRSWSYVGCRSSVEFRSVEPLGVLRRPGRLRTYVSNNYHKAIHKGRYYRYGNFSRHSKVILDRNCPLTGFFIDQHILQPVYDFIDGKVNFKSYKSLMGACFDNWILACRADYLDQTSLRAFIEDCEANNREFLRDGTEHQKGGLTHGPNF